VSFLQKAKEKASEVAREAGDASARAAGAVSTRARDPETQERVKSGLATAGKTAADASTKAASAVAAKAQDPATQAKVKSGLATAGRGARTMVERIDPGILAEVIIKATALQEKANARLRRKGSMYRIGEIQVTASLPPGISFSIERVGDADHDAVSGDPLLSSTELLAEERAVEAGGIVSLDTHEQAAIVEGLADAAASMDATVEVLQGATQAAPPAPVEAAG
jgi:predicted transcriptional regulator